MIIFLDIDETFIDPCSAGTAPAQEFAAVCSSRLEHRYSLAEPCTLWRALREQHALSTLSGVISGHEPRRRRVPERSAA